MALSRKSRVIIKSTPQFTMAVFRTSTPDNRINKALAPDDRLVALILSRQVDWRTLRESQTVADKCGGHRVLLLLNRVSIFALWARITKNPDCNTGSLARPFPRSLTRLLAPHCLLCLRAPLCSLVHSHAHFAHLLTSLTLLLMRQ